MISLCGNVCVSNTVSSNGTRKIRASERALGRFIATFDSAYVATNYKAARERESNAPGRHSATTLWKLPRACAKPLLSDPRIAQQLCKIAHFPHPLCFQ